MNKTQIAAIDFGTSKIVTIIARNGGIDRLEFVGTGTVPYDGFQSCEWNTPGQMLECVKKSIAAAELEANEKVREIYIAVPGEFTRILTCEAEISLNGEEVTQEHMDAVQDVAAENLRIAQTGCLVLHRSPAWFQIDDGTKTVEPRGQGKVLRTQTSFIVASMQFVEDMKEMMGALGITILGFLSATLGEILLLVPIDERDRVCTVIDCGYLNTEVSVIYGEAIIYHAVLPLGGGHITGDLARQLRIPMRAAEQIKRKYVFNPDKYEQDAVSEVYDKNRRKITFPREIVKGCIEKTVDEICEYIDLTFKNDVQKLMGTRSQVYLTGGGLGMMRGAADYLSEIIGMPVKIAAPKTVKMNSPVYSSALGFLDLTFDSIEKHEEREDSIGSRISGFFRKKR